jgi:hypothetical protein
MHESFYSQWATFMVYRLRCWSVLGSASAAMVDELQQTLLATRLQGFASVML